jgi:2-keto-4-pentenoate hydratase
VSRLAEHSARLDGGNYALRFGYRSLFSDMDANRHLNNGTIGRVSALLYVNEAIEETGVAAGVLGHPANGVAWLANRLAAYDEYLPAGQVILSGSFTRPVFVRSGDVIHADFGDLGAVTCQFV